MTNVPFPRLDHGNAAVMQLREWIKGQREAARQTLETETDLNVILRTQGRAALLAELERCVDPAHQTLASASLRGPRSTFSPT